MWQTISEVVFFDNSEKEAMSAYFKSHPDWHMEANGTGVIFTKQRTVYTVLDKKEGEKKLEMPNLQIERR